MHVEPVRRGGERGANVFQGRFLDRGLAALVFALLLTVHVGPASVEPVGLVRLEGLACFELLVQMRLERGLHILDFAFGDQAVLDQPFGVEGQRRFVGLDPLVHHRIGEHRFVAFVVTEAAVAEDVDHDVLAEFLAELGGNLGRMNDGLRVVTVDVEDRCLDHQGDVRRIRRGAREVRRGGEADLVVHNDMDRAAGFVPLQA